MQKLAQPMTSQLSAWQAAEEYGFDMSLVEDNLRLTPWERICRHSRALNMALTLREAMEKCHAGT